MQRARFPAEPHQVKRVPRHPWPMVLALVLAIVVGWLVFTILRPAPLSHMRERLAGSAEEAAAP